MIALSHLVEFLRSHALALPILAKFAIAMAIIVCIPRLSHRIKAPAVVGLLLSGIVLGPHGLDVIGTNRPIANFFAELGQLLLLYQPKTSVATGALTNKTPSTGGSPSVALAGMLKPIYATWRSFTRMAAVPSP